MSLRAPQIKNQIYIFPELLSDKVEHKPHAARFYSYLAGILELNLYKSSSMGSPPYARPTLVAVILYAMHKGYYESGKITSFAEDSIGAQWILNGMKMPSYKTVERIIQDLFAELDQIFTQILELCRRLGLIGEERIYIDGTKIKANASKHKAMSYEYLNKKIVRGKEELKALFTVFRETLEGIEELPEEELQNLMLEDAEKVHRAMQKNHQQSLNIRQEQLYNIDADKKAERKELDTEKIKKGLETIGYIEPEKQDESLEMLNDIAFTNKRVTRMEEARAELEERWKAENGNKKIPEKQQINFTDPDSNIMKTKHQGVQQCYNHFALVDDKANIILGTYTSNNACDQLGLVPTIENTEKTYGSLKGFQLGADAGFFSADNITYAGLKGIDYYASYPEGKNPYAKDKFKYDEGTDTYICPHGSILMVQKSSENGEKQLYSNEAACGSCKNCDDCTKAKDGIRRIERDMVNDKIREDAKEKAKSEEGREILRKRKSIPEPVWGNIKVQDQYTQMNYRGSEKAGLEFKLHCLMQNIRKLLKVYLNSKSYQEGIHSQEGIYEQPA